MSNQISVFNFNQSQVRIQIVNNEPLFCLKDIAEILNISNAKSSRFNLSEAGVHKMYLRSSGQQRELTFINEPNLYRVIFRSNKKEAVEFQNWVFDEVLPTIRKTGSYSLTINSEQQQAIKQAVNERSYRTGEHYQAIYTKLYEQFKIPRYQDLPASKFEEAIKWLGGLHSRKGLSDEDLYDLARLVFVANYMREKIKLIEPALRIIDSSYSASFHSMSFEFWRDIESARLIINRETAHIKTNYLTAKWNMVLPVVRNN